jgi:predicted RNA-binding protein with PUA-like domain
MRWWLFKTEPSTYSWDDLVRDRRTHWEGIRNYQARNLLRDEVRAGDLVFVYHSVVQPQVIAGLARVVRDAYPDHFAWDHSSRYFDPKSNAGDPSWLMVDIEALQPVEPPLTRDELKTLPELAGMMLLKRGARLSIQPVTEAEAAAILALAGLEPASLG